MWLIATIFMTVIGIGGAQAHYYNATFDCGKGQHVWIGNPVDREHGRRIVVFEVRIIDPDFTKPISSNIKWDADKDTVTLGREVVSSVERGGGR